MSYIRIADPSSPQDTMIKSLSLKPSEMRNSKAPVTAVRRKKLLFSYAMDWLVTIGLGAIFFSLDKVDGYRRVFSLEDTSLRHPHAEHERVPNVALYFICFGAPFLLQPIVNYFTVRSWWDLHNSWLGLVFSLALTGCTTQFVKITVGRPRPDFIARCIPPEGLTDPRFGLTSWTVCTQTDNKMIRDGFRSFFSGHTSMSFAGLGFFSFYLAGKMHLFDKRGQTGKAWLALAPFAAAALVAISRSMDYRHHWQDILVGSIVGTIFSYFSYRQYYPPLESELSHRPYSPRIKRDDDEEGLPTHIHHPKPQQDGSNAAPQAGSYPYGSGPYGSGQFDENEEYELEGTVQRPDPGPLEDMWKSELPTDNVRDRSAISTPESNVVRERSETSSPDGNQQSTSYENPAHPEVGSSSSSPRIRPGGYGQQHTTED